MTVTVPPDAVVHYCDNEVEEGEAADDPKSNERAVHEDEQLARDIQMAQDLQDEEDHQRRLRQRLALAPRHDFDTETQDHTTNTHYTDLGFFQRRESRRHSHQHLDHMLFVTCEVDGRLVEMLVDSGASASCISYRMVVYLGLTHRLNSSVRGEATGVGKAHIVGVLENVSCQIGHVEFRLFFLVLDTNRPYLILGLDLMRRFSCVLDLENNQLLFGGREGVSTPFLEPELAHSAAARPMPKHTQKQQSGTSEEDNNNDNNNNGKESTGSRRERRIASLMPSLLGASDANQQTSTASIASRVASFFRLN